MSSGPGKDVPAPLPENLSADSPEGLLTSEDLFGDLVDEPIRNEAAAVSATPARATPIRVRVSEAGESTAPNPKPAHVLPEDMSVLLDAFSDSSREPPAPPPKPEASAAPKSWAETRPSPLAGDWEDLSGLLDSMAPTATAPPESSEPDPEVDTEVETLAPEMVQARHFDGDAILAAAPATEAAPQGVELEPPTFHGAPAAERSSGASEGVASLNDRLEEDTGAKTLAPGPLKAKHLDDDVRPPVVAIPPPAAQKPVAPPTDLDQLLEGVFGPATSAPKPPAATPRLGQDVPGLGELLKSVPQPVSRTATKFQAAAPKIAAAGESRMMLDLASLAEDALSQPPPQEQPPAPPQAAGAGDPFGPYQLLERVATGGMAEVFRAKRTGVEGFEKVVALKRILPHLSDNKEFVDMFVDEAKMVAGLTHPNIVQIYDLGKIDSTYFIAMEYIHGRDLRTILRRAKDKGIGVPLELCVLITARVAAALDYAHRKKDEAGRPFRIVHRDVSPQNILTSFEGEVKLTDFGIAKATSKATSTDRGALRGKLLYMSPEQAMGKPMDRRADVFSLGVCFYEMLTDRKPFMGTSEKGILDLVRECRVSPPSQLNPRVSEQIEKIVMKALDREPEHRYQDAGVMLRDLEGALALRQAPTALELSRFMEVLFESEERGVAIASEEPAAEEAQATAFDHLEIDLEPDAAPAAPAAPEPEPKPAPGQAGFGRLLKKFGIK